MRIPCSIADGQQTVDVGSCLRHNTTRAAITSGSGASSPSTMFKVGTVSEREFSVWQRGWPPSCIVGETIILVPEHCSCPQVAF